MNSYTKYVIVFLLIFSCVLRGEDNNRIVVKTDNFFRPNKPEDPTTQELSQFMVKNPDIQVEEWSGLTLPGSARTGLMMAIAGKTAPDMGLCYFSMMQGYSTQGLLYPLNEWIGDDLNGDGVIDDSEAKWEGWKKIPLILRRVATVNGKVYGLPLANNIIQGIVFRVDLAEAAGLDPANPPKTWSELLYWCRKLTYSGAESAKLGIPQYQRGIALVPYAWSFLSWIRSAGGEPIVQYKTSPKTGKRYVFGQDATKFITSDGENLISQPSKWHCNLNIPECIQALDFFHKLRWGKWVNVNGVPMELEEARAKGIKFDKDRIITGVSRFSSSQRGSKTDIVMFTDGECAMMVASIDDLYKLGETANIDPALLSWFPFPAADTPKGQRVVQTFTNYAVMFPGVGDRPKRERDAVWRTFQAVCDQDNIKTHVQAMVLRGMARFVPPAELKRLGYEEYLRDVPALIRRNFKEIAKGEVIAFPEPWMGQWHPVNLAMTNECLGILLGTQGENFDYVANMIAVNDKANGGLMFATPEKVLQKYRPWAWGLMVLMLIVFFGTIFMIVKSFMKRSSGGAVRFTTAIYHCF